MEEPFYFSHDAVRLFGVLHQSTRSRPDVGVVFCHPFGEERQFSDHVLVRFARLLAASGFPALRFDRRGKGESDGDLHDVTVETQIGETLAAAALLRARLDVERVILLGLRWGATVAALAAEREPALSGLVLWSPIVSGAVYARELIRRKVFAQLATQEGRVTTEQLLETLKTDGRLEFEGDYLTLRTFDEISAIRIPHRESCFESPVLVGVVGRGTESAASPDELAEAYRRRGAAADIAVVEGQEYWDDRAMFGGLFPDDLYAASLDWIRERRAPPS